MSADAWVRYWKAGWILGIVLVVYGGVESDLAVGLLGVVTFFLTFAMVAFWRQRAQDPPASDSN